MICDDSYTIIEKNEDYQCFCIKGDTGYAVLTEYDVFPGVHIIYNDVHMDKVSVKVPPPSTIFEINHCSEGRIECEFNSGEYMYLGRGDLSFNMKAKVNKSSVFPLGHYHGITVSFDFSEDHDFFSFIGEEFKVDLKGLRDRICGMREFTVMRMNQRVEHIFSELYEVPASIRRGYFKVKVLELLLFLSSIEKSDFQSEKKYFRRESVEAIKAVERYITSSFDEKITIEQLSEKFQIPLTTMKSCFKEVYGDSIHAYVKKFRLQKAAELIKNTDMTIGEIASTVGYDNASKFSGAFKNVIGNSPGDFRKIKRA